MYNLYMHTYICSSLNTNHGSYDYELLKKCVRLYLNNKLNVLQKNIFTLKTYL